jgi:hypothetical protein
VLKIKPQLFLKILFFTCISLSGIIFLNSLPHFNTAFAEGHPATESASQEASNSRISSWLDQIDMHWGGRLKSIGSATFARDDTVFEPVGTGTYLNVDTDLRINNLLWGLGPS